MDTEKTELWDRLENEPERGYRAFECFLNLPSGERTLLAAYRQHVGNPDAVKPSDTWSRWSSEFAWRERAAAYDDHLATLRREAHEQVIKEQAQREARQMERARGRYNELMTSVGDRAMEWLEDAHRADLRGQDVIQIIRLHMDAVKAFEVDRQHRAEDDWTEEDDDEFADLIVEIDEIEDLRKENSVEDSGEENSESDHLDETE